MSESPPAVLHLGRERFDEIVDTLCDAFHDYPVMRFVLEDAGDDYGAWLHELIAYFTDLRVSRGWPVLGVEHLGRLAGAANVTPPESVAEPPAVKARYQRLRDLIGDGAIARFQSYADAGAEFVPDRPHYYLGMVGVRRALHGRGLARPLMDAVHEMSAGNPSSVGVVLSTETPENLPFYEHFGYRILGCARVGELQTWTLFRPD